MALQKSKIKSWREEVQEEIEEYIQVQKKQKESINSHYKKVNTKTTKVFKSQECKCGFWLDKRHYSTSSKKFYCPSCDLDVDRLSQ